jgi:hypothetical protein
MKKVAFICLGAYTIKNWSKEQNFDRQSVYSIALSQALSISEDRTTKENNLLLDFFIVENTIENNGQIIEELREQLKHERIQDVQFINNNSAGSVSKGAGEYVMCSAVISKHKDVLETYDWIIYYTMRQTIISPLVLSAISKASEDVNVIVGNPIYLYLSEKRIPSAPGNYCDMIFAMRPKQFFSYITSMSPEELIAKNLSSEKNLFDFIDAGRESGDITSIELERLGVMRHNYAINRTEIV